MRQLKVRGYHLRKGNVDALSLKRGPSESGILAPPPQPHPVGGELAPIDTFSVFMSQYGFLLILVLLIPLAFILYKKRSSVMNLLVRAHMAFWRLVG